MELMKNGDAVKGPATRPKWEKETGQTFNRRIHEVDHVLAHAHGGANAEDNLQVLTRKKNRSKGAKLGWREKD
jgi:5-methylcytosine-specific restriction endonuclease McrA